MLVFLLITMLSKMLLLFFAFGLVFPYGNVVRAERNVIKLDLKCRDQDAQVEGIEMKATLSGNAVYDMIMFQRYPIEYYYEFNIDCSDGEKVSKSLASKRPLGSWHYGFHREHHQQNRRYNFRNSEDRCLNKGFTPIQLLKGSVSFPKKGDKCPTTNEVYILMEE